MKNTLLKISLFTIAAVSLLSFAVYLYVNHNRSDRAAAAIVPQGETRVEAPQTVEEETGNPFLSQVTGSSSPGSQEDAAQGSLDIIFRLCLAVILSSILAFRPRRNVPLFQRNLYVAQTQILLAVVAAALMMIVGDSAARAFAIFAAVSLVRFRTNIKDPKEITVLLLSLALGLAAGVGRWRLGIALCLFVLGLLWLLEHNETEQTFRSMELTVKTRDTDKTQDMLKRIFDKYKIETEIREIKPADEDTPIGSIVYYMNLRLTVGTDRLSEKILSLDQKNIEAIEWSQKKNAMKNLFQ